MADSTPASSAPQTPASTESKAQEQARLRRERRNAKLQAGGSERLNKINAISGRPLAAEAELENSPARSTRSQTSNTTQSAPDPEEVDIANMIQRPPTDDTSFRAQEDMIRAMLRAQEDGANANGGQPQGLGEGSPDDPLAQMMQQMQAMLGGQAGAPGGQGFPAGLQELFGGAGGPMAQQREQEPQTSANYIWRIVHTIFSLMLGIYAVMTFRFAGSEVERMDHQAQSVGPRLFWVFTTSELVLQSGRYFIDGGKLPGNSVLTMIGRFLPDPWGNYVRVVNRYSIIYTTLLADAMVLIFVLGTAAWWKGLAAS